MLTTERQQYEQWWETAMHNGYPPRFGWEHWRDGDGYRDDDGEFQGLWQAWQASRGFLANREEQPVAYLNKFSGVCMTLEQQPNAAHDAAVYVPLYLAPPAPAMLDALKRAVTFYEQVKRENTPIETGAWKDAVDWVLVEACRAAMLAAAPEGGNG